jgi:hypothetical protein
VPITTDALSSNRDQGEVYHIMVYSLSVTCGRSMVFATNKTNRDDITEIFFESGVKHNPTNTQENKYIIMYGYIMDFI